MRSASAAVSVLFALASSAEDHEPADLRDLTARGPGHIDLTIDQLTCELFAGCE